MTDDDPLLRELRRVCAEADAAAADFERFQLDTFGERQRLEAARSDVAAHRTQQEASEAWTRYIDARIQAVVDTAVQVIAEETARIRNEDCRFLREYVAEQFARWSFVTSDPDLRNVVDLKTKKVG